MKTILATFIHSGDDKPIGEPQEISFVPRVGETVFLKCEADPCSLDMYEVIEIGWRLPSSVSILLEPC